MPSSASFELVVYGGTPAGIVCAVRAAREGLSVALVNVTQHLGGMLSAGLGLYDVSFTARHWAVALAAESADTLEPRAVATACANVSRARSPAPITRAEFEAMIGWRAPTVVNHAKPLLRGDACLMMLRALARQPTLIDHANAS